MEPAGPARKRTRDNPPPSARELSPSMQIGHKADQLAISLLQPPLPASIQTAKQPLSHSHVMPTQANSSPFSDPNWWHQNIQNLMKRKSHVPDLEQAKLEAQRASPEQKGIILNKAMKAYNDYRSFQEFEAFWELCAACMPCPVSDRLEYGAIQKMAVTIVDRIQDPTDLAKVVALVRTVLGLCNSGCINLLIVCDEDAPNTVLPPDLAQIRVIGDLFGFARYVRYKDPNFYDYYMDKFRALCLAMLETEFKIDLYQSLHDDENHWISNVIDDLIEISGLNNSRFLVWAMSYQHAPPDTLPSLLAQFLTHFDLAEFANQYGNNKQAMDHLCNGLKIFKDVPLSTSLVDQKDQFLKKFHTILSQPEFSEVSKNFQELQQMRFKDNAIEAIS